ncbi:MAG: YraN family protein [Candidatus Margulisbacteria bacterium]|nr:YraN family protein [Candidatus Margulisiibacteriota bacterium]
MGIESYKQGVEGEEIAEKYLRQLGYQILDNNFHSQQGEVDIIAKDHEILVFIEVKNYSFRSYGSPLSAVRKSKRDSIIHAARTYLLKKKIKDINCRFDVLTIYRRPNGAKVIDLYKNAFQIH